MTDQQIIEKHHVNCRARAKVELRVVHHFIKAAHKAGYTMSSDEHKKSMTERELIDAIFDLDECYLSVWKNDTRVGFVELVMGNDGYDVICDYSINLNSLMGPIEEWIAKTFAC